MSAAGVALTEPAGREQAHRSPDDLDTGFVWRGLSTGRDGRTRKGAPS